MDRISTVNRSTKETNIKLDINIDGGEGITINSGVGFFDHMLHQLFFHGRISGSVKCNGDLEIDDHHTIEDIGISLGQALREATQNMAIERFASLHSVMDDAMVLVAVDFSGRGYLGWNGDFKREQIGGMSSECIREFFKSVANYAGITLHINILAGVNDHHVAEAMFKGFGVVLHRATRHVDRIGVSSTKGVI